MRIATALTVVKIALISIVGIGAFVWVAGGTFSHFSLMSVGGACEGVADSVRYGSPSYTFMAGVGAAMLGALWGYDGWNNLTLVAGETLFAYTDGVVDARDIQDEPFGEERLMALLASEGTAAAGLLDRIDAALSAHITTADQFDDVAMLATRRCT